IRDFHVTGVQTCALPIWLHIAEVLNLTVADAFTFFRTHPRLQRRLQVLKDVGLDYLPLGQPTASLSGGESQRLKLASFLTEKTRSEERRVGNGGRIGCSQ